MAKLLDFIDWITGLASRVGRASCQYITGVLDLPMPRFGDNSEFLLKALLAPLVISVVEMVERHFQLS
jgi:hypothetical protein